MDKKHIKDNNKRNNAMLRLRDDPTAVSSPLLGGEEGGAALLLSGLLSSSPSFMVSRRIHSTHQGQMMCRLCVGSVVNEIIVVKLEVVEDNVLIPTLF